MRLRGVHADPATAGAWALELLENTSDGVLAFDREWRFVHVNPQGARLLGRSAEALLGSCLWTLFPELEATGLGQAYRRAMHERVAVQVEAPYVPFGAWLEVRASPSPHGLSVFLRDVTASRTLERERSSAEARYRELVEHAPDGIFIADLEGRYTDVNGAGCLLLGCTRDQLIGLRVQDVLAPEELPRFAALHARVRSNPGVREVAEWTLLRSDGKRVPVELSTCLLPDGRWQAFARDISTRRHAQEALRRRDERSRFLSEAGERLLASLDVDETLHTLAQLVQEHVAPCCLVDLLQEDGSLHQAVVRHREPGRADILRTLQARYGLGRAGGERLRAMEERRTLVLRISDEALERLAGGDPEYLRLLRALGTTKLAIVPLVARGRPLGALSVSATEPGFVFEPDTLQLLEALAARAAVAIDNARLYAESQAAIRARDAFLSIASHELNTPLTSLKLQLQSLERRLAQLPEGTPGRDEVAPKFQVVGRQLRRLASLVSELLDLSRISVGRLRLEPEPLDLAALVREVLLRAGEDLQRSGCTLREQLPERLVGELDRLRVDQVVTNLVSNAMKYGAGSALEVGLERVRLPHGRPAARLRVRDGGIGISAEQQQRLFRRFERLQSERHYSGFGLGLWIVKQVVDAMGGEIRVQSAPGEGALFEVLLPLEPG